MSSDCQPSEVAWLGLQTASYQATLTKTKALLAINH
jgi:hypothetical protein